MRFSVIIPVYNAEKTLQRCLDSLLPQLNSDIEVLLINDGSTDSSETICKEYVLKNQCFHYYEQENSGVSAARNKGLDNAVGKYILFVDSDDYVDSSYFDVIENYIRNYNPDLLVFGNYYLNRGRNDFGSFPKKGDKLVGVEVAKKFALMFKKEKMYSLCDKVFVKQIIKENNIFFSQKLNTGEDMTFIFHYILYTDSMAICRKVLYYVDESTHDSLSRRKRIDLIENMMTRHRIMLFDFFQSSIKDKRKTIYEKILSWRYYRNAYSCFNDVYKFGLNRNETNKEISNICSKFKENHVKPRGMDTFLISLPVSFKLVHLISFLFKIKKGKG